MVKKQNYWLRRINKKISSALRRARSGLNDPKTIRLFFVLGPTGVGKTETAKSLASFLFDDEKSLLRIDMSNLWKNILFPD